MANIYRKINTDLITTVENIAYTVPSNSRALVKSIHIYNEGAGAKEEFIQNILVLQENDKLKFLSDITGPDVTVSLLELNREDR